MKLFRQDGPPLASPVEPTANARRIAALGFFDPLTRLRNRRCFDHVMARRVREGCAGFGLIIVDIDRLKIINSTLGHAAGDSLIREVAARLRAARVGKQIFRLSSDEFAVVDEASTSHAELARTAARIVERMNVGMQLTGIRMMPQVSMGGAVHGVDGVTCEMLRQNADMALQEAKKTNRGGYVPFAEPLRRHVRQHQGVIVAVDDALESGRIMTYYQPLARLDTREIVGLEALSRMRSTDGMVVAGGSFQAAFADPCLSYRLTDQMLAHVARDVRSWLDAGIAFQHVGINLAAADFQRPHLCRRISDAFDAADVPLDHVVIEVTETVMMDGINSGVVENLVQLRRHGARIALDDFGTGYASLTHLLNFPVDIVKIDKSFVDRMLTEQPSAVIVEAILEIARRLDLRVVAEGVETEAQAARLEEMGCKIGQGYVFGRATDAASTLRLLQSSAQKGLDAALANRPKRFRLKNA